MKNVLKILGLLTLVAIVAFGCKKKEEPKPPTIQVEDGFYIVGKGIVSEEMKLANMLEDGWIDKFPDPSVKSPGLMVKLVYVKAGEDGFVVKQQAGSTTTTYGLDGAWVADTTGGKDWAWFGKLKKDGAKFTVPSDGLYFFAMDVPSDSCFILKVKSFEVVGNMTGWGYDENFKFTQNSLSIDKGQWKFENLELKPGKEFKVRINATWNYKIAQGKMVQTNWGMGADLTKIQAGGANYSVGSSANQLAPGIYKIVIDWAFDKGLSFTFTKTGDVQFTNWTNTKIEIVGSAVDASNNGAIQDNVWGWGYYLYAMGGSEPGLPYEKTGNVYKWKWENVKLNANEGWKVRCRDAANSFDAGNNIIDFANSTGVVNPGANPGNTDIRVEETGNFDIELTIDAENGDSKVMKITKKTTK